MTRGATRGTRRDAHPRRRLRRELRRAAPEAPRRDDRLARELHALHAAPARGRLGDARATPRGRPAPRDVPARGARPRPRARATIASARPSSSSRSPGELEIGYERLVVALGATTRTFPVPGLAEHGLGFKDLADAIALRNRVLQQLERASIHPDDPAELGFVFVGAGYAGVEALAELNDMAHAALRSYPEPARHTPALGARRRGAEDPPRDPAPARRVRGASARAPRRRDPRRHDARVVRRHARPCSPTARAFRRGRSSGRQASARTRSWPSSASRSTSAAASSWTRRSASREPTTSGRSATARRSELQDARASSTRRRASTRCARRGGSRRT